MRKYLVILSGLLCLFAGSVFADTYETTKKQQGVSVTGKRYRKNVRHLTLAEELQGDKKKVYQEFGYTPHRLRFDAAGQITERWIYYDQGLLLLFDEDSNLIEQREIPKQGESVTGKRYRKNVRHPTLAEELQGDKKQVYQEFGYTPHRLRFSAARQKTERWIYYDQGLSFLFDEDSKLIEKREIPKQGHRSFRKY